jgi:hypothetical protein
MMLKYQLTVVYMRHVNVSNKLLGFTFVQISTPGKEWQIILPLEEEDRKQKVTD